MTALPERPAVGRKILWLTAGRRCGYCGERLDVPATEWGRHLPGCERDPGQVTR